MAGALVSGFFRILKASFLKFLAAWNLLHFFVYFPICKQIDISFSCICPVIDNEFRHDIFKVGGDPSGAAVHFDNIMTKFIVNNRTDALKADINLFFVVYHTLVFLFNPSLNLLTFHLFSGRIPPYTKIWKNIDIQYGGSWVNWTNISNNTFLHLYSRWSDRALFVVTWLEIIPKCVLELRIWFEAMKVLSVLFSRDLKNAPTYLYLMIFVVSIFIHRRPKATGTF